MEQLAQQIDWKTFEHDHIWVEVSPTYGKTNYRYCALCHEPGWLV